jgi:spore maturation protein CgeB
MGNAIYKETMTSIYQRSKIILNFLRTQNAHAHNMRTFEVPATKSFLLTERTEQQAELFLKENYSIACFAGIDELVEKINTYLHDTLARELISERSFVAAQEYTLHKQLRNYIDQCPALR